jgi:hypothetical protein
VIIEYKKSSPSNRLAGSSSRITTNRGFEELRSNGVTIEDSMLLADCALDLVEVVFLRNSRNCEIVGVARISSGKAAQRIGERICAGLILDNDRTSIELRTLSTYFERVDRGR